MSMTIWRSAACAIAMLAAAGAALAQDRPKPGPTNP
jgi:hypothetical protein